ncbi:hypothetical protein LSAT2_014564 [Lamellibrachia satsuma]|nr:hypothetical protein LSAT2_014564 [Lamellibrachia satsuma]
MGTDVVRGPWWRGCGQSVNDAALIDDRSWRFNLVQSFYGRSSPAQGAGGSVMMMLMMFCAEKRCAGGGQGFFHPGSSSAQTPVFAVGVVQYLHAHRVLDFVTVGIR